MNPSTFSLTCCSLLLLTPFVYAAPTTGEGVPRAAPAVEASSLPPILDGVALSLYYEGPGAELRYEAMVDRIADSGALTLSVVVQWSQPDIFSSEIAPDAKETPADADVRRVIRHARARGLSVMVFPILWVSKRAIGEWRGTLAPVDEERWWESYERFVMHYAELAADEHAALFSVGSEFASLEDRSARWRALIREVRGVFPGKLIYSANWDHYAEVTFWDQLDYIGLTAYYRLTEKPEPSLDELVTAWSHIRNELLVWRRTVGKPMVFTELGYPSLDGAANSPWDYTAQKPFDFEEQRLAFEAFRRAWADEIHLAGVYFWNGWGPVDGQNGWYVFWGKPAEQVIRRWLKDRTNLANGR